MLEKISTPILLAIILYHSYHYYAQWKLSQSVIAYHQGKMKTADPKPTKSTEPPKVVKVTDNVYVAIGYALANSIMLIGDTGVVIVDTTESVLATEQIYKEFRKITDKPIKGIVYTHNHADHVMGTKSFLSNDTEVEIWAHHTLVDTFFHSMRVVGQAHYYRSMHQFGAFLKDKLIFAGIGKRLNLDGLSSRLIPPNRLLYKKQQSIHIAGMDLELMEIPGETDDQIAVYWPAKNVLLCADDFYKAFPNLYAIRGTHYRSLKKWKDSIDTMRKLQPEYLVPSHTDPVIGAEVIYNKLTNYRDAIQLVHDQTVRMMNLGLHPDEIANRIKLPKSLEEQPYLKELYGTVKWSSKSLFTGYMGWFSGDIAELSPHTPTEQAHRLIKLAGGIDAVISAAEESLKDNDPQWALRLSSAALRIDGKLMKAREIKSKALLDLASLQTSMNGYNYYATCAYSTIEGKDYVPRNEAMVKDTIRSVKMEDLFYLISLKFKAEECMELDKVVSFIFPDTKSKFSFHVRHGIMDLSGGYNRQADIKVTVNSVVWREIVSGERSGVLSALKSDISVEPSISALQEVMGCIDKSTTVSS